ncbi:MAG: fumarate reductase (quinol) flavoprotein subunit [Hyphomicrobiales bacterium]|nr:fumarate reductase (quinol) flavoprotein subunit [Hyphomicrobiales bacterium]
MQLTNADVVIIGAGGAGLRAAIEVARSDPNLNVALISKVYPMRSHTCAAEGGAAGVAKENDTLEYHFHDTVAGGDWLTDQDAVDLFVNEIPKELTQMEHWGCPWSREQSGHVAVRPFGGMKIMRTWFAADKTGFHMLHTLFQTSLQYPSIKRFDEFFTVDLLTDEGQVYGCTAIEMRTGQMHQFRGKAVIICSGGAGKIFPFTTNGAIKTGDGMAMAYRAGVPLKDMEFVQYHPTGLPGSGILLTEGCRGEGGYLVNKDGYRYLQDYGLGPETPTPVLKAMELGPRDRLSQAFWHEQQKGRTVQSKWGDVVYLDMRHLGEKKIDERLPLVRDLSRNYVDSDPVHDLVPVRPVVHYMMGGIHTDINAATPVTGLYAAGECACVSINGANRLGSNSLGELLVFGSRAARYAMEHIKSAQMKASDEAITAQANDSEERVKALFKRTRGGERVSALRKEMNITMEDGCGIYRDEASMKATCETLAAVRARYTDVALEDKSSVYNTDLYQTLELGSMIDVSQSVAISALQRTESRGAHQRLDHVKRDDEQFLKHSMAHYNPNGDPRIDYLDVVVTKSQPAERVYGKDAGGQVTA